MLEVLVVDERLADPELLGGRPHELLRQARPHRHRVLGCDSIDILGDVTQTCPMSLLLFGVLRHV